MKCKHCLRVKASPGRRGLCRHCAKRPELESLYPKLSNGGRQERHEPTAEEIDALIAEQLRPENRPWWWDRDTAAMAPKSAPKVSKASRAKNAARERKRRKTA